MMTRFKWLYPGKSKAVHMVHLVDLDGAKAGHPVNDELIGRIASAVNVPVQVGGGLRTVADVERCSVWALAG